MNIEECWHCHKRKARLRTDKKGSSGGWIYVDENGSHWIGRRCPDCRRKNCRDYHHKTGISVPAEQTQNKNVQRGRATEKIAKEYFESLGFTVSQADIKGPDLVLTLPERPDFMKTVEVKPARRNGKAPNAYRVDRVCRNRRDDDFIAIVMPNGTIWIEPMDEHLKKCGPGGWRSVTKLVHGVMTGSIYED